MKLVFAALFVASGAYSQNAHDFKSPDILVLGDSQLPFGSGPSFLNFFENVTEHCGFKERISEKLGGRSVAVIGVRSTSLGTWTKRSKKGKRPICRVDPNWKVNAGTFGTVNKTNNIYAQIGKGENYQFCKPNKSAFEAMLRPGYYSPKLLVLTFLGNSSGTWANSEKAALRDVQDTIAQLPPDLPCIFMTSAPTYQKKVVDKRLKAQTNIKAAFKKTGNRCSFVDGYTPETIKANLGVRTHFRQRKSGKVKDPFHPNKKAASVFFRLQHSAICAAVAEQLNEQLPKDQKQSYAFIR